MTRLATIVALAGAALALAAAPAAAHPIGYDDRRILIVDDRPPPPPPPPPPPAPAPKKPHKPMPTSIGFRLGGTFVGPASGFGFGLQGGVSLSPSLRGIAEYEYILRMIDDADRTAPAGTPIVSDGSGHRGRLGLRVNLGAATLKHIVRFYADADATAGLAMVHGPMLERTFVPELALGLRLGYEMLQEPESVSPSKWFDAHLLFRLVRTEEDTGLMFGVGMEWGK